MASVTDWKPGLSNSAAPYGAVTDAELGIRGLVRVVTSKDTVLRQMIHFVHSVEELTDLQWERSRPSEDYRDVKPEWVFMPDTEPDRAKLEDPASPVYCLKLVVTDNRNCSFGLLLGPAAGGGSNCFRRIGVYFFSCLGCPIPMTESVFQVKEMFFQGDKEMDLLLV
jgi:hypothetical protein